MNLGRRAGIRVAMGVIITLAAAATAWSQDKPAAAPPPPSPSSTVAAWRVECTGDGKTLDCQALQQMFLRQDNRQGLLAQFAAWLSADTHQPVLQMQLPLGINVAEPLQLKVDSGSAEHFPLQTCTGVGCFATVPLGDKLLASMRAGTTLKITLQDTGKHSIGIDVPLLGFGLAFDKATK